ncbi:MAG: hypothetical protein QM485_05870 [Flavobacteriaceae bacterium]
MNKLKQIPFNPTSGFNCLILCIEKIGVFPFSMPSGPVWPSGRLAPSLLTRAVFILCLISMGAYGQKQTKTYKESFKASSETVLDINTSHADIEFETWNRPEVSIEATIEIDGVSKEEAEQYFEHGGIEIVGNSEKVSISTGIENTFVFAQNFDGMNNFHFEFPEISHMGAFPIEIPEIMNMEFFVPEIAGLIEIPPMPPMPLQEFDYEAFKKDGEKYLKKWQKEFSKGFNKNYEQKLEEWSERMEAKSEKMMEKKERLREKRMESRARIIEKQEKNRMKVIEVQDAKRNTMQAIAIKDRMLQRDSSNMNIAPNIFYFSSDGENKNYKVKKTIKIKMPKATKIKMNVRHGEVILAENTRNIKATVSHSSLLAATIDGEETIIRASYSPVSVQNWNYGQLQVNYSDYVHLKEVLNLRLSATSSDVVIGKLLQSAFVKNDLGPLRINSISKDFKVLDVSLQNAEFECVLPNSSYTIYVNGTNSKFFHSTALTLEKTQNLNSFIHKGYHIDNNTDRSLSVIAQYSTVVLE